MILLQYIFVVSVMLYVQRTCKPNEDWRYWIVLILMTLTFSNGT